MAQKLLKFCKKCAKAGKERERHGARGRRYVTSQLCICIILVNANVIDLIDANYITIPTNQGKKTRECFEQKRPLYQI